jgi:hypothetical protein
MSTAELQWHVPPFAERPLVNDSNKPVAEDIIFDVNLQEFATRIGYICGLEANGKLTTVEAYEQIKQLWKQLKRTKKGLRIGEGDAD